MPWQECNRMDERLKFVARVLDGEKIAVLCREFGISRKTGHKIISRYNACGLEGLTDRSRRPYRHANQLPFQIEKLIVRAKQEKPNWAHRRSENDWRGFTRTCKRRRSRPCTRCSTATGWSSTASDGETGHREHHSPNLVERTTCGAPITRMSSCSPTSATAIR